MPRLGRAGLLGAVLLASSVPVAWAQGGGAFQVTGFVCIIDLEENGLFSSTQLNADGLARYPSGLVSTRNSKKVCTASVNPNINISCTAQITGWQGGVVNDKPVACVINSAACGLPGQQPVPAQGGKLNISAGGAAALECNFRN